MSLPSKVIVPPAAGTSPLTVRASVLLPAPLEPSTATISPVFSSSDTSWRASAGP